MLQLICYYNNSWVSNIGSLVLVSTFWFRIIKCGWICMLKIIPSNFLKIRNGWAIVNILYITTVVYVFLENTRSHSNACIALISLKKTHTNLLNGKGIDDSAENMSGITDEYQNYEKRECKVWIVTGAYKKKRKVKVEDF